VRVKGGRFIGFQIHKDLVPMLIDEIPILAVLSMFADGVSEVRGAKELRYKESDRIHSISENIKSIGGKIVEFDDGFMIEGNGGKEIKGGYVKGYNDHRIIMAFYIAGLKSKKGVNIDDISWIKISYPEFIKTIEEVIV
jgi:3-phosphoshikimate 1-carboxyvinyltransferase